MQIHHHLAPGDGDGSVEADIDASFVIWPFGHLLLFPLQALAQCFHAVHLVLEVFAHGRSLPRHSPQLVLDPLVDLAVALQLGLEFFPFLLGQAGLSEDALLTVLHILSVTEAGDGMLGLALAHELFQMDDGVSTAVQEQLIVGHENHGDLRPADKALQPLDGLQIQIIAGFVQKQHRRSLQHFTEELELDLFPA